MALKSSPASVKTVGDAEVPVNSRKAAAVLVSWVRVPPLSSTTRVTVWWRCKYLPFLVVRRESAGVVTVIALGRRVVRWRRSEMISCWSAILPLPWDVPVIAMIGVSDAADSKDSMSVGMTKYLAWYLGVLQSRGLLFAPQVM